MQTSIVADIREREGRLVPIIQGRLWAQVGRLSRTPLRPYLLVEGCELDAGPLSAESVRGALLAVGELGIVVVRASDPEDSALWLAILARRPRRRRRTTRVYAQRPAGSEAGPERWLSVPGIGPERVRALAQRLARGSRHA